MKLRSALLFAVIVLTLSTGVLAEEKWVTVRSDNFHLIGNGDPLEIGGVATRLEQFREVFGFLFPKIKLTETVETKVIVFRDRDTFRPFLPRKQNGTPDEGIGGYFLTAESANYIVLTTAFGKEATFEMIFHEYVHYLLNNNFKRSGIPPWLNEGLAEYYSTMEVENGRRVILGNVRKDHLYFLKRNPLIPLRQFFAVDNYSLHESGDHSRTMFYAQAWALVHYLSTNRKLERLDVILAATAKGEDPEQSFKKAFGLDYKEMEAVLSEYVKKEAFPRLAATLEKELGGKQKLEVSNFRESDANADLGSLLYHRGDLADAEVYLKRSLALDKNQALANTSMGLLKLQQDKFSEAVAYLERAVVGGKEDYYVQYSYAYVLSRMSMNASGFVMGYEPARAQKMRRSIMKAIELNDSFVPSYNLLAFVNLATGENLEESVGYLKKVLALQPGNETASLTLAQIYIRLGKLDEADTLATAVYKSTSEKAQRETAKTVLDNLASVRDIAERNKRIMAGREDSIGSDLIYAIVRDDLSDKEVERIRNEREISVLNKSVLEPGPGERRSVGYIKSALCTGQTVNYKIETTDGKVLRLRSNGFRDVRLKAVTAEAANLLFDCGSRFASIRAVLNYRAGVLKAVTFVPPNFRLKSPEEIAADTRVVIIKSSGDEKGRAVEVRDVPNNETKAESAERIRKNQLVTIAASLRRPGPGEKRSLGRIEKVSCNEQSMDFHLRTSGGVSVFSTSDPRGLELMVYGQDPATIKLGCGLPPPVSPVVITYKETARKGVPLRTITYLEFVLNGVKID